MRCQLSDEALWALLHDDATFGDLTTELLLPAHLPVQIRMSAREEMILCGTEEACRMFQLLGANVLHQLPSGAKIGAGTPFLEIQGTAEQLFMGWKVTQVLLEWASGIASATRSLVDAAGQVPVACTRKQTPGTKAMSIKAVRSGGGIMHRLGLSETILIFAEHRQFLNLMPSAIVQKLRLQAPEKHLVVEVHSIEDAIDWIQSGVDVVQMDKFSPDMVRQVALARQGNELSPLQDSPVTTAGRCLLAAAGGVKVTNAADYVAAGADLLVTSAPYQAAPKDVQVNFH